MDADNAARVAGLRLVEAIAVQRFRMKDEQSVSMSLGLAERTALASTGEVAKAN